MALKVFSKQIITFTKVTENKIRYLKIEFKTNKVRYTDRDPFIKNCCHLNVRKKEIYF